MGTVFVVAVNAGADGFAGEAEGNEDHPAIDASHACAEVGERVDGQYNLLMIFERGRYEFFRRAFVHAGEQDDRCQARGQTNFLFVNSS